ncbi:MAG: hypothetical protein LUG51_03730 [Tannerellaceae bacterium]|nr:hypothetical protein [Tannerellaceae bacterium]
MKKKNTQLYGLDDENGEKQKVSEEKISYQTRLDQSIQQAKEGKTVKVTTDAELKKLLDSL